MSTERKEEGTSNSNSGEHRDHHTNSKGERKAFHQRGAEPEEDHCRDHRRDVRVADRKPCAGKTVMHCIRDVLPFLELFFHTLEDENVGVHRHTNRENETGDTCGSQRDWNELEDCEHERNINRECERSDNSRDAVPDNEKECDDQHSKDSSFYS